MMYAATGRDLRKMAFAPPDESPGENLVELRELWDREVAPHFRAPMTRAPRSVTDVLARAMAAIPGVQSTRARDDARRTLCDFATALDAYDLSDAPVMMANMLEDGALVVEWAFRDRRLGFSFDPDEKESGWFFVSVPSAGGVLASGNLSGIDCDLLATWVMKESTP